MTIEKRIFKLRKDKNREQSEHVTKQRKENKRMVLYLSEMACYSLGMDFFEKYTIPICT
jgi:hypothetical protein